jgi:HlyD family secretion protein
VWWSRIKVGWPVLVWALAVAGALVFFFYGAKTGGSVGMVEIADHPIAPLEMGRLASLDVVAGQSVCTGDVLARMETRVLDAEIAAEQAIREQAQRTVPVYELDSLQMGRQFSAALAATDAALAEQRIRQAEVEAELGVISNELSRLEDLLEQRLIDASSVALVRARYATLRRAAELYPVAIRRLTDRLGDTRVQQQAASGAVEAALGSAGGLAAQTNFEAEAAAHRIQALTARREACILRAPADGVVAQVNCQPGEVVAAGVPILRVVERKARRVIGFLPEVNARDLQLGQRLHVSRTYALSQSYAARLTVLEPAIRALPGTLNPIPQRTMRGRRIIVELTEANDLLPGETVEIRVVEPLWSPLVRWLESRL